MFNVPEVCVVCHLQLVSFVMYPSLLLCLEYMHVQHRTSRYNTGYILVNRVMTSYHVFRGYDQMPTGKGEQLANI